ncbi:MAG: cold shock domain-containing protein [Alphaproteobacteria bacterium]|jgi:CspA family cold shock protein
MSDYGSHSDEGATRVNAVVKWFNPAKGFGFVQPEDGSPDAFLHVSVLEAAGHRDAPDGAAVVCDIARGPKGLQVTAIHSMDSPSPSASVAAPGDTVIEGNVKFFDAAKGYGFVIPDEGTGDVFVSGRVLHRAGISALQPDTRVRMTTRMGDKGPMAESVEII